MGAGINGIGGSSSTSRSYIGVRRRIESSLRSARWRAQSGWEGGREERERPRDGGRRTHDFANEDDILAPDEEHASRDVGKRRRRRVKDALVRFR
jgi:hypothetical protein